MRILMFSNTFPPGFTGGAEVANYHHLRGMIRRGAPSSICVLRNREAEDSERWYELDSIPVHQVHMRCRGRSRLRDIYDRRMYRIAHDEIQRFRPDVVHFTNCSGSSLAPFVAASRLRVPSVLTLHDLWMLCPNNMLYRKDGEFCDPRKKGLGCCGRCLRRYDYWGAIPWRGKVVQRITQDVNLILCPSQAFIERHVEAGYPRERFRLVRYGIEPERQGAPVTDPVVREIIASRHQYKTIVFGGGGIEIKGAQVLQQALPRLLRRIKDLRVIIAGDGYLLDGFRPFAPQVRLVGKLPFTYMRQVYGAADLVLLPSVWHENLPLIIFEACQVGTPIVGSEVGGIQEIIEDGKTGYLFPVGNAKRMADCILEHFTRPALEQRRMRQACLRKAAEELTYEQHLNTMEKVYAEAMRA